MCIQQNGVAMGVPLAPVIADIFMAHMETTLMDRLMEIGVCEWHKYVDDTFVLIEPTTNVTDVPHILNNFHPSIKFTYDIETDQSLPFLDVKVTRLSERQTFETTIYRKPTFTGLMTKWNSFVPMSYKKAGIDSMIRRALSICSTYQSLAVEFDEIRRTGRANNYHSSFIDIHIGIGMSKYLTMKAKTSSLATPETTTIEPQKKRMYVAIPYIGQTTSSIKNKFTHLSSKLRPDLDIRYFTKPPPSAQSFFQNKDRIEKHMQSNIVYSVNCSNCEQTYVGKTDRQAIRRMKEHGAPINTYKQITTTDRDADENQLRRSSRIRDRKTGSAQLPGKTDDKKAVRSALSKHEKDLLLNMV
jgi:hypothetical protein